MKKKFPKLEWNRLNEWPGTMSEWKTENLKLSKNFVMFTSDEQKVDKIKFKFTNVTILFGSVS